MNPAINQKNMEINSIDYFPDRVSDTFLNKNLTNYNNIAMTGAFLPLPSAIYAGSILIASDSDKNPNSAI